ncbi:serine hydroxymethyltransferase [Fructilactobacillus lindneri]|uniref:Serine hydroxymethyltransferase n=2 Tax=Fructilactobacillus lindneri TaxID=53444 RepID=A0A0R2JX69_9LACO|nr:serine hydroxymethyltransferase [Fructilactobacillus lindneri]ANZ57843.1 serine hydroxymethyltransferase [Fructilactobacillus lindneri]ANZ59112.1 serine hydroxymethyltransferase [Fructilactobacillus lindneri]KRN78701.1 serine hydroxymethyltransferase [Fructilactobacillus lindneri DSM 20690 = JCM 11027]POG98164.1 serine hydroxymethyltransferase [Fructilactobacillus lindneri]POH01720.1 serine hydroxymethyltransferase [Fructilactobacillus lindneri]
MYDFSKQDPTIWNAVQKEEQRQEDVIELIASENLASKAVRAVQGSVLTNKYAVGYPESRVYTGNEAIDVIDNAARNRAKKLFNAEYANVFPHSGTQANQAVYSAFLQPGDKILSMSEHAGGHFTHGQKHNFSGKLYDSYFYGVNPQTELLDYDEIARIAHEVQPKLIIAGASAYSHVIDWWKFRDIADEVGAYLMVDMAYIAGLVAGGVHPNPVDVADVVTSTTHKTLRGPRGGMILAKRQYAKKLDQAVFPVSQSGTLEQVVAAKAIAYKEDLQPEFREYTKQVIKNAQAMAAVFKQADQIRLVSGGTENHEMTLDLNATNLTGAQAADLLYSVGIATNKELLPLETDDTMEGIRVGTPTITSRGFDETDAATVAELIVKVLNHPNDKTQLNEAKMIVTELTNHHPATR